MGRMPGGLSHCGAEEAEGAEARVGRVGGVPITLISLRDSPLAPRAAASVGQRVSDSNLSRLVQRHQ